MNARKPIAPPGRAHRISTPEWAAIFGVLTPFLANMPIFDSNPLGNLIRYSLIGAGLILIAGNMRRITANLKGAEVILLVFFTATVAFESVNAFFTGFIADPYSAAKLILITLSVYLVSKLLDSRPAFERYMDLYCKLALIASVQVIASVFADYFHIRRIFLVPVSTNPDNPVFLGLGGLLGTIMGGDFRSCFYFSEAGYFGQFLLPAFAYAFQTHRNWSIAIMSLAFLGSLSTAAIPIAVLIILIMILRFGRLKSALVVLGGLAIMTILALYLLDNTSLSIFVQQDKTGSYHGKLASLIAAHEIFQRHALGIGMIDLNIFKGRLDPAAGIIMMMLQFGVVQLPLLIMVGAYLFYFGFIHPADRISAATALGIGAAMGAALILGPIMKYYTVFMLGALVTYVRIAKGENRAASVRPGTLAPFQA